MTVPLSDREQKILEEIEQSLYAEDPDFAKEVKRRSPWMDEIRQMKLGAASFAGGLALLLTFFFIGSIVLGVLAFGAMVGGIVVFAGALRTIATRQRATRPDRRERITRAFEQWEAKLRQRYKKP
jgi:hypothetical protein